MFFLLVLCSFSEQDLLSSMRDQLSKNQSMIKVILNLSQFLSNEKNILTKDKIEAYTLRSTAYLKIGKLEESLKDAEKTSNNTLVKLIKEAKAWLKFSKSTKSKETFRINCHIKLISICPFSEEFILNLNHILYNNIYDEIISKEINNLPRETFKFLKLMYYFTSAEEYFYTTYNSYLTEFNESSNFESIIQKVKEYKKNIKNYQESKTDEYLIKCKEILQNLLIPTDSPQYLRIINIKYPNQQFIEKYYASQLSKNNNPNEFYSILGFAFELFTAEAKSYVDVNREAEERYNELKNALEFKEGIDLNSEITKKILEFYQNNKEKIYDAYFVLHNQFSYHTFIRSRNYHTISYKKVVNSDVIKYIISSDRGYLCIEYDQRTGGRSEKTSTF